MSQTTLPIGTVIAPSRGDPCRFRRALSSQHETEASQAEDCCGILRGMAAEASHRVRPGLEEFTATTPPRSSGRSKFYVLCRAGSGARPTGATRRVMSGRRSQCRRPPRAIPRNLADAVVRPRCPGSLGAYGEVATNGWRVCGPRPQSSPSKGRTVGDTRLVAVISARIGCGVSDATARVGSRMTGDSATVCTWPPMLSIAVSSGVLAAVVLTDYERVLPYLRDYADQLALARGGDHRWTTGSCSADGW